MATIDHFSTFSLGNGVSPSAVFVPTLQGFQVGMYTGAASASVPLVVPKGPAGIAPDLSLSY